MVGIYLQPFKLNNILSNFTHAQSSWNPARQYPVMFWVHGGSNRYGSGIEYDGRVLAQEGVVVVITNYRLGVFGKLNWKTAYGLLSGGATLFAVYRESLIFWT